MKREGGCAAEASFQHKSPRKKKEIIIMPSGKRASRKKMPQFICEKRETKRAQLGANLVFKAITKGNEANSLWQII